MAKNTSSKQANTPSTKVDAPATPSPASSPEARVAEARAAAFVTDSQAAAFAHFRPLAEAVDADGLPPSPGKYALVRSNVADALQVLVPALPHVAATMVTPPIREVLELPALALALSFAASRVPARTYSAGEIAAARAELGPLREVTLSYLEVAAHPLVRQVPAARVQAIRSGKGAIDNAQDGIAIAGLFAEFAESLANKHPFEPAQIVRLEEIGNMLVQTLQPADAAAAPPAAPHEAARLRDQFEALLAERYEMLKLCASVAFNPTRAQALIPALRRSTPRLPSAVEAPADEPPTS